MPGFEPTTSRITLWFSTNVPHLPCSNLCRLGISTARYPSSFNFWWLPRESRTRGKMGSQCTALPEGCCLGHILEYLAVLLTSLIHWHCVCHILMCYGEEKVCCTGPTRAAKTEQKSLVPARWALRTNQGRTPFIGTLWVPIHISFNSRGHPSARDCIISSTMYVFCTVHLRAVRVLRK